MVCGACSGSSPGAVVEWRKVAGILPAVGLGVPQHAPAGKTGATGASHLHHPGLRQPCKVLCGWTHLRPVEESKGPRQSRAGCQGAAVAWGIEILHFVLLRFILFHQERQPSVHSTGKRTRAPPTAPSGTGCALSPRSSLQFSSPYPPRSYTMAIITTHSSQYCETWGRVHHACTVTLRT